MKKQYVRQLHDHGIFCADAQCVAVYRADDADKRIAELTNEVDILNTTLEHNLKRTDELEKALRKYGWHDCCSYENDADAACDCGWRELNRKLQNTGL